jgi:hypothetical protein
VKPYRWVELPAQEARLDHAASADQTPNRPPPRQDQTRAFDASSSNGLPKNETCFELPCWRSLGNKQCQVRQQVGKEQCHHEHRARNGNRACKAATPRTSRPQSVHSCRCQRPVVERRPNRSAQDNQHFSRASQIVAHRADDPVQESQYHTRRGSAQQCPQ